MGLRWRLLGAPWWVLTLVMGGTFALVQLVVGLVDDERSSVEALVYALVVGALFGLVMGPIFRRQNRKTIAAMGALSPDRYREVGRAASRGPVPADPEVRRAARSLLDQQLEVFSGLRWAYALWLAMIALNLFLVVTDSAWWLLSVLLFGSLLALQLWQPRRLEARRRLLEEPAASAPLA